MLMRAMIIAHSQYHGALCTFVGVPSDAMCPDIQRKLKFKKKKVKGLEITLPKVVQLITFIDLFTYN